MKYLSIIIISFLLTFKVIAQWINQNQVTNEKLNTIVFVDSLYGWIGGSNGIIISTTDGGNNWTINTDTSRGLITSLNFINRSKGWAVTSYGKILKTTDGGFHWSQQYFINTFLFDVIFINEIIGYIVASPIDITQPETIYKTTNGGDDWSPIIISDLQTATSAKFIDENKGYVIGGFPAKIFETNDGGNNWFLLKCDSLLDWFSATDFKDFNNGLLGGFEWGSLYQTTNGGQYWSEIPLYVRNYRSIIYRENKIWILVEGDSPRYILHSFDNGAAWFPQIRSVIGEGLLDVYFINDTLGWAVGNFGIILKTVNGGYDSLITPLTPILEYPPNNFNFSDNYVWLRWYETEGSLFRVQISTDSLFNSAEVYILLPDNGLHKGLLPQTKYFWRLRTENPLGVSDWSEFRSFITGKPLGIQTEELLTTSFYLRQNYPNPFNSYTTIEFSIPFYSFITLKIYDILGREIKTLISSDIQSGNHKINFDASDFASGIYIYQLRADNSIISRKLILLK
ncbi:MAG: T9SS type A sorting domain-containing protein [Ignavibacterium sp.]|nr:T9SS type A sorting domain-containing protein [Ignavibacterium sp.]